MTPRVNDPRRYSGRGEAMDAQGPTGEPVPGTAGAQDDIDRYRGMAWAPPHPNAVQINQARSNEARGITSNALDMLRSRAEGAETPAQRLARQQTQGAVAGIYSGAASIKGGAGARAAAARGAWGTAARVGAQGAQDAQALRAREMADAAGQYMGGASMQRGQDLTLAGDQAKLEAQHRAAQDQREQHYEQAAFDVGNADNLGKLGADAQDVNAASAAYKQDIQNSAAQRAWGDRLVGTGVGTVVGGVTAYGMTQDQNPAAVPPRPGIIRENPYGTGSDERMKVGIRDLTTSDARAKKEAFADGMNYAQKMQDTGEAPAFPPYMQKPGGRDRVSPEGVKYTVNDKYQGAPENPKQPLTSGSPFVPPEPPKPGEEKAIRFSAKRPSADPMPSAMRAMEPSTYQYKPGFAEREGQSPGETNVGPMAQKLQRDPIAATTVVEDPHTGLLGIDQPKALKLAMGGLSALQRQIDELKGRVR